jgi:two-component system response regulator
MNDATVDILLVEDSADDVRLTLRTLEQNRIKNRIHVARDGQEALDYIFCREAYSTRDFSQIPKLILLDLELPKVSGIEVLRQIRADPHTRDVPVAVLVGAAEADVVRRYGELGVSSYIRKPLDFEQFCTTVKKLGLGFLVNQSANILNWN